MNKEERRLWESWVEYVLKAPHATFEPSMVDSIIKANSYILKLERELQNIKQTKKIGAILKPK